MQTASEESLPASKSKLLGYSQLAASLLVIGIFWLGVFPYLANQPAMQKKIEAREQQGITLDAMFYTDLEIITEVEANFQQFQKKQPDALWNPWSKKPSGN